MKISSRLSVFNNSTYLKMYLAQLISQVGTFTGLSAMAFYMLDRFSTQPIFTTITELMYSLPTLFVFLFTGVIADKLDRKKILLWCDGISGFISILLLFAIYFDSVPLVFLLLFLRSGFMKFFHPAGVAIIQGVLSKEEYPVAIGFNQMLYSIFVIIGSGLGAVAYWNIGISGAIIVDSISFFLSGLLIYSCSISEDIRLPNGKIRFNDLKFSDMIGDFKLGISYTVKNPIILSLYFGVIIMGIVNGAMSVIPLFMMKYNLTPTNYEGMQVILSWAFGIGILLGSIYATRLVKKIPLYKMIIASFVVSSLAHFTQSVFHYSSVFVIFHFIYAFSVPLCNVAFFGWIGQIVEKKMMGRVQALITPLMMFTFAVTQGIIAIVFPKWISIEALVAVVGFSELLISLFYFITLPGIARKVKDSVVSVS
ncbi:MFS transporter [Bacillus salitolerans]|uniref:MFS transporter n=1 Tax=Bacillus salitolerans TaxID=1437434 RepID=A0ABW4LKF3_9BACI